MCAHYESARNVCVCDKYIAIFALLTLAGWRIQTYPPNPIVGRWRAATQCLYIFSCVWPMQVSIHSITHTYRHLLHLISSNNQSDVNKESIKHH